MSVLPQPRMAARARRNAVPGAAAQITRITPSRRPRIAIAQRSHIRADPTIINPLKDIPEHVVQAKAVRSEADIGDELVQCLLMTRSGLS